MGALLRLELHGFPHPVAELAATVGGYRGDCFRATLESFDPKTNRHEKSDPFSFMFKRHG
jgi:hypothetical protein